MTENGKLNTSQAISSEISDEKFEELVRRVARAVRFRQYGRRAKSTSLRPISSARPAIIDLRIPENLQEHNLVVERLRAENDHARAYLVDLCRMADRLNAIVRRVREAEAAISEKVAK